MRSVRSSVTLALLAVLAGVLVTPSVATGATTPQEGVEDAPEWADWEHTKSLTVTERSGRALSNYPVVVGPIEIGGADPASIRVVNETADRAVDFAVREREGGYALAFKTDVAAGGTNDHLAVYYGNPDADSVAVPWGAARYNFHDDFEDGQLHPDWTGNRDNFTETGGTLRPHDGSWGDGIARTLATPLDQSRTPVSWETRVVSRSTGGGQDLRRARIETADGDGHRVTFVRTYQNRDDGVGVDIGWDSPDRLKVLTADQFAVNDWLTQSVLLEPSGDMTATVENERTGETATNGYPSDGVYSYSRVEIGDNGGSPGAEWDYVRLRYKVSPEPTVTVGQERSVPGDAVVTGTETDRSRTGTSPGGAEDPSTPDGGTDAGSTDQQLADSDGDGMIDSADYAPRDPDVQERSDLESTTDGSGPGFGVGAALVAVLVLLAVVGTRR